MLCYTCRIPPGTSASGAIPPNMQVGGVLEQKGCSCTEADCSCQLRPVAFSSRKLQGTPGKGQRAWHICDKETYAIVATL